MNDIKLVCVFDDHTSDRRDFVDQRVANLDSSLGRVCVLDTRQVFFVALCISMKSRAALLKPRSGRAEIATVSCQFIGTNQMDLLILSGCCYYVLCRKSTDAP